MDAPSPRGHWTAHVPRSGFKHLRPGRWYRVVQPFTDYDGEEHPAGEEWQFLTHNYLPYDDGLSLFVSVDGEQEWHIRLQWSGEAQGAVINRLRKHIARLWFKRAPKG